eukprot:305464-Amphidinium_carterae.2
MFERIKACSAPPVLCRMAKRGIEVTLLRSNASDDDDDDDDDDDWSSIRWRNHDKLSSRGRVQPSLALNRPHSCHHIHS